MLKNFVHLTGRSLPKDFSFYPEFFSSSEQNILLRTSLEKLDSQESPRKRRERNRFIRSNSSPISSETLAIDSPFLPEKYYEFSSGHFDSVIYDYREMHLSSWPEDVPGLRPILDRIWKIAPSTDVQTHLLHLASTGEILPHVDNLGASGSWILGISLGSSRILRMTGPDGEHDFDALLPSGSLYIQTDSLRYNYKHSILRQGIFDGREVDGGQRLSIMIRDRKPVES